MNSMLSIGIISRLCFRLLRFWFGGFNYLNWSFFDYWSFFDDRFFFNDRFFFDNGFFFDWCCCWFWLSFSLLVFVFEFVTADDYNLEDES